MQFKGTLLKMPTENYKPVRYFLELGDDLIFMNQWIGKVIEINHTGYECKNCKLNKPIKSSGYCTQCFFIVPQTLESIFRPEKSKAHLGIEERDLEWEKKYQLQPHVVYLANTSGLKVGVTRQSQKQTRWIDQGAIESIVIATTENRFQAGQVEVALSKELSDKTNYRKMLTDNQPQINLLEEKLKYKNLIPVEWMTFYSSDNKLWYFEYPVLEYPKAITSIKLKEGEKLKKKLIGIKGQYLIFDDGTVLNVRSHEGFVVNIDL